MKIRLLLMSLVCFASAKTYSQWTDHFALSGCTYAGSLGSFAYAGNSMGFTLYDTEEHSVQKCTKANHLSDIGVSAVKRIGDKLYVGYTNGNIDIVDIIGGATENIPELKNNNSLTTKRINNFCEKGNLVYASTQSGLIVIDKSKTEIKSFYPIRNDATVEVLSAVADNNYIYAATSTGLFRANASSNVLEDPAEWQKLTDSQCWSVVAFGNDILSAQGAQGSGNTAVVSVGGAKNDTVFAAQKMRSIYIYKGMIVFLHDNSITIKDNNYNTIRQLSTFSDDNGALALNIYDANIADENTLVLADYSKGVVVADMAGKVSATALYSGPATNQCHKVLATPNHVYVTAGGLTSSYNNLNIRAMVHCYTNGEWTSTSTTAGRDVINICADPLRPDTVYVSSWGNGIFKIADNKFTTQYTPANSSLQDIFGGSSYIRVNAIAIDRNSNLVASNSQVTPGLVVRSADNNWYGLSYAVTDGLHSTKDMIASSNGHFWLSMPRHSSVMVFDINSTPETDTDDRYRANTLISNDSRFGGEMRLWDSNGDVITDKVITMAEDRNGQIWFGTDDGIVVFKDDAKVFDIARPVFSKIKVPRNDGTNNADYLLDGVVVNTIAVDGANRKWIGTETDGVYLVSDDGLTTIHAFNQTNSPLPSNEINSIAIEPVSGEVFIATANGVVSFAGTANEPEERLSKLKIYPNPVTPTFKGYVKIHGLEDNTTVVITDINGRLVSESISQGGMCQWNVKDTDGNDVSAGTYMIWAANHDGTNKGVGKILVIR